jgi:PleD family two-component response regulator
VKCCRNSSARVGAEVAIAPFRVLLVDDFERFRRLISALVQSNPQLQVVGEASDGFEAVEKAKKLQPDLILLDLGLPKLNGIEAARKIRILSRAFITGARQGKRFIWTMVPFNKSCGAFNGSYRTPDAVRRVPGTTRVLQQLSCR